MESCDLTTSINNGEKARQMDANQRLEAVLQQAKHGNIVVRKAVQDDMTEVANVFKQSRTEALPYLPDLHTAEEDVDYFTNVVFLNDQVYLAEDSTTRKIVGFIAFNHLFVDHLYLLSEASGQGTGSALLELAKDSTDSLRLWVFQKNQNAIHFYQKNGFTVIKETDGSYNEEKEPDALMQWHKFVTL